MKLLLIGILALAFTLHAQTTTPQDSLPPAFQQDTTKAQAIRNLEAGKNPTDRVADSVRAVSVAQSDSLEAKLHRRRPFLGVSLSFAFSDLSSKDLFAKHDSAAVVNDTLSLLQTREPVTIYFPIGLVAAIPVFPYFDLWLRTESFWYKVSGLAEDPRHNTHEYWYAAEGNLIGIGARFLVPVSLLSVNGHPGLYVAGTEFWSVSPTYLYSNDGHVRAINDPAGAGYEIQTGFQQDFDKRWTWTGALAFTSFSFKSNSAWTAIIPDGPATQAQWTLRSLRLCLMGFYQFGTHHPDSKTKIK